MFFFDVLYGKYVIYVEERKALQASIVSSTMYIMSSYITLKWIEDTKYVIPAIIGAFLGTYWVINNNKR